MRAGQLNRRCTVQRRTGRTDAAGQPLAQDWADVGQLWVGIGNETGMSAIRSTDEGGVPASLSRYSFLARFDSVRALSVDAGMRLVHDGEMFSVLGVTRDFKRRDRAYIVCEIDHG